MALLAARAQLLLARQGQELLEQKRDALLREFHREVDIVFAAHAELEGAASAARLALDRARVRVGSETVAAAAICSVRDVALQVDWSTVMGVSVPVVAPRRFVRAPGDRGRAIEGSGPAVELAAERFEAELAVAVRLATMEARVRRLAREIRRTSRRANALRTRVVPSLVAETRAAALALQQREREDRFRLKRMKSMRTVSA
jgi:V/A-type H+-transporting ATPase subunit D